MLVKCRKIFILAGICCILIVAYCVISASEDPNVTGRLYKIEKDAQISEIIIWNQYGEFRFYPEGNTWMVESEGAHYRTHAEKMDLMLAALYDFGITRTLDEMDTQYGLDKPLATVEFRTNKGNTLAFGVGNETVSRAGCYVRQLPDGQAAVADIDKVAQLTGSLTAYRDKNVFTVDASKLVQIGRYENGELSILLSRMSETEWEIAYPFEAPARAILVSELLESIGDWTIAGFPDMDQVTMEDMGLGEAQDALMLVDANGGKQMIEFGTESGTGTFVRTGGEEDVAILYTADIGLNDLSTQAMIYVAPLMNTIDQTRSIAIEADGARYKFEINDAIETVSMNGRQLDYESFIRLYYRFIMIMATGRDEAGVPEETASVAVLDMTMADGGHMSVEILPRDSDTYFLRFAGQDKYYIPQSQLDILMQRLHELLGE